ncbi:hypothetical protein [Micromonospora lupini]|uniref:hypothetical protein n=1 Tax=Micromonospora lupini TaxID=285679 RepID=UPI0031D0F2D9
MTENAESSVELVGACHMLLGRMAGRLPDELVTEARWWLAEGELVAIAQAVVFAALTNGTSVTTADAAVLEEIMSAAGADVSPLADLVRSDLEPVPAYGVAPVGPDVLAQEGPDLPYTLDLSEGDGPGADDALDAAAVRAVRRLADETPLVGLWRAWRYPAMDTSWPPPRRVYLVQADAPVSVLPMAVARIQDALVEAGEREPQVEGFVDPDEASAYQRAALGFSALLWAPEPAGEIVFARVFDSLDTEQGPRFDDAHPRLDDDAERARVLTYLRDGIPLLISATLSLDVYEPAAGEVVPTAFYTDGTWIWPEAVAYYLERHGLAPEPELLAAIRAADHMVPPVDAVTLHRALAALYVIDEDEPLPADSTDEVPQRV